VYFSQLPSALIGPRAKTFCVCVVQDLELPDSMSSEMRSLLEGLLQRDVPNRLGCRGGG
jgi:hypothetical protein